MAKKTNQAKAIDVRNISDIELNEYFANASLWACGPAGRYVNAFAEEIIRLREVINQMNIDYCEKDNYE